VVSFRGHLRSGYTPGFVIAGLVPSSPLFFSVQRRYVFTANWTTLSLLLPFFSPSPPLSSLLCEVHFSLRLAMVPCVCALIITPLLIHIGVFLWCFFFCFSVLVFFFFSVGFFWGVGWVFSWGLVFSFSFSFFFVLGVSLGGFFGVFFFFFFFFFCVFFFFFLFCCWGFFWLGLCFFGWGGFPYIVFFAFLNESLPFWVEIPSWSLFSPFSSEERC